jgi:hypothetical protein
LFEAEMACSRRGSRCVGGSAEVVAAAAGVAVGIEIVVVAGVGRRRSLVEIDRMHQAIVPVVFGLGAVGAMDFEEQLIVVGQMDLMEQMFVIVFSSRRD